MVILTPHHFPSHPVPIMNQSSRNQNPVLPTTIPAILPNKMVVIIKRMSFINDLLCSRYRYSIYLTQVLQQSDQARTTCAPILHRKKPRHQEVE